MSVKCCPECRLWMFAEEWPKHECARWTGGTKKAEPECVFCRIIAGLEPADIVYEDEMTLAFLPLTFASKGQTLVIPKKHVANFHDFDEFDSDQYAYLMTTIRKLAKHIKKELQADGLNLISSDGSAATQTVFHLHFHIVPRWENDGFPLWPGKWFEQAVLDAIKYKVSSKLPLDERRSLARRLSPDA